jgi:hypothetical protein
MYYTRAESLDRLRHAYEMEEGMNGTLLPLCQDAVEHLPPHHQDRIQRLLASVLADTRRHARIVTFWLAHYEKQQEHAHDEI